VLNALRAAANALALHYLEKVTTTCFCLSDIFRPFDRTGQAAGTGHCIRVYIYNTRTEKGIYNNTKGEFTISASKNDVLVAALPGYAVDTIKVNSEATLLIYLRRNSIQLKEVIVRDSTRSPEDQLKATKEEYDAAYKRGNAKDIFSVGGPKGTGGAGLSIDALYNLLSRSGRDARQLQKVIERDYHDALINYRYNRSLVTSVTNLTGAQLTDFIQQYKPSYNFAMEASDYEMIKFIKASHKKYLQNPAARRLPTLTTGN
jgi:hypothetical protein